MGCPAANQRSVWRGERRSRGVRELLPQAEAKGVEQVTPTAGPVIVYGTLASVGYGIILMVLQSL